MTNDKKAKLNAKKYFSLIAVILLLIFLHNGGLLRPLEGFLNRSVGPFFKLFYSASSTIGRTYRQQTDKQDLSAKLAEAQETINRLNIENAKLKFLHEENEVLRKHLNFFNKDSSRYQLANVISRGELAAGNAADSQTIVINKGAADGIYAGLAAVSSAAVGTSSQGVIIGKVVGVKDHISQIYLVTNKNSKLAASILGENKTSGIAQGELGLTVKMNFIPQTENIKVGDIVATSGLEPSVPRGLIVGKVSDVKRENNDVWQSATIEPMVNLDDLGIVAILLP